MKWKKYRIPIYDVLVYFVVGKDTRKVEERLSRRGLRLSSRHATELHDKDSDGCCIPVFDGNTPYGYLFWVPEFNDKPSSFNTMAHEICHIKNYVWEHICLEDGVAPKYDEVEAYLVGHLTEQYIKFVRR